MATVTDAGVTGRSMLEYITDLQGVFRGALGSDLDLAAETPQSQIIAAMARMLAETDAALVAVGNRSFNTAAGYQLDDYGALLDFRRRAGNVTLVTTIVGGDVGAVIPILTAATDAAGNRFATTTDMTLVVPQPFYPHSLYAANDVVIGTDGRNYIATRDVSGAAIGPGWERFPHSGYTQMDFQSESVGAFYVPIDGLSIQTPVLGIDAVYNKTIGRTGQAPENDETYRRRFAYGLAQNAGGTTPGVIAAMTNSNDRVAAAYLLENVMDTRDLTRRIPGAIHPGEPLVGGAVTATVAQIVAAEAAITSGNALVFPAVHSGDVAWQLGYDSLDLSGAADMDTIASRLQTALRLVPATSRSLPLLNHSTVVYRNSRLEIAFSDRDLVANPNRGFTPRVAATGALSDLLGLSAAAGASADYLPPYSIAPLVDWQGYTPTTGDRLQLAIELARAKPAGVRTYGATNSGNVIYFANGAVFHSTVYYTDIVGLPLSVAAIISVGADFPADGIQQMQQQIADYINGLGLTVQYSEQAMWGRLYQVPGWTWGNNADDPTPGTDFVVTGGVTELNDISRYTGALEQVRITAI